MRAWIGITDGDWYRFLRSHPERSEINFWQPRSLARFRVLTDGEPFLFKLHSPENFIVGGGFFAGFEVLPASLAWECFGIGNGAASIGDMRRQIARYRRIEVHSHEDYMIGCVILNAPFYLDEENWLSVPGDFSSNLVRGKSYDLSAGLGKELWTEVQLRIRLQGARETRTGQAEWISEPEAMYGDPVLVAPRLGQGAFRALVTGIYGRRCAVTQEKALPVLDAAHIRPVSAGGVHALPNGLLFRADIHRLFDAGYVTVTPDLSFRVSHRLKADFDNGEPYYPYDGGKIQVPRRTEHRPDPLLLEWHADTVFRG